MKLDLQRRGGDVGDGRARARSQASWFLATGASLGRPPCALSLRLCAPLKSYCLGGLHGVECGVGQVASLVPGLTSDAAPSFLPFGHSCSRILFLFVPESQSTLHSWLLGVFGISSCPHLAWEALYLLPHNHPVLLTCLFPLLSTVPALSQLAVGSLV